MKLYQHIYVYKIMFKIFNIRKIMNPTVIWIFARYLAYLLICCAMLSKKKNYTVWDALIWIPMPDGDIAIYASSFLKSFEDNKNIKNA